MDNCYHHHYFRHDSTSLEPMLMECKQRDTHTLEPKSRRMVEVNGSDRENKRRKKNGMMFRKWSSLGGTFEGLLYNNVEGSQSAAQSLLYWALRCCGKPRVLRFGLQHAASTGAAQRSHGQRSCR